MPRKTTPAEGLALYADRRDSEKTPQSVGARMPMWLFRMVLRAGKKHGAEDLGEAIRLCEFVGANAILSGDVKRITDDIASAMKGEGFMGTSPPRKEGKVEDGPYSEEEALQSVSVDRLIEVLASKRPDLVICPQEVLSAKVLEWSRKQTEDSTRLLREKGVQTVLGLS